MNKSPAGDITQLLLRWRAGEAAALDTLLPLVYQELRAMALRHLRRERSAHTMLNKLWQRDPDNALLSVDLSAAYGIVAATALGPKRDGQALAASITAHRKSLELDQFIFDRTLLTKQRGG